MCGVSPVRTGATVAADLIGFSPLPVLLFLPQLMSHRPIAAHLTTFTWTSMAGGLTCARLAFRGTNFKKSAEMVSGLLTMSLLTLGSTGRIFSNAYKSIEFGSSEHLVKMIGNGALGLVEVGLLGTALTFGTGSAFVGLRGGGE